MRISKIASLIIIALSFLLFNNAFGQYEIDQQGTVNDCSANFWDSDSTVNYLDNETYIMTLCSDGSGNSLNIGFGTLFDIDPSDTLFVYDGASVGAPLIGAYNNNNILIGVSTLTSGDGCLTFKFVSDGAVTGAGWKGIVNCLTICQPVDAIISTTPSATNYGPDSNYTNICAGDVVQFSVTGTYPDATANVGSYAQNDVNTTFDWEFGNGSIDNGTNVNSTYTNEQGYLVILTVTDVNGCIETVRHKVRTGITPEFTSVQATPDTSCFGMSVELLGGFTQTIGQNSNVTVDTGYVSAGGIVSGQTYLPDGNGNSYTTDVNISGFSGQTIQNGSDVTTVCLNMEHSYIGDLDMTLTCPNGTSIILMDGFNGAGNGNTFLGDAQDNFAIGNGVPGIGMDYCFDLGAAWGTMTDENINNNWIPATVTPGNNILTPGSFQPFESFNNLIGCPIDGNWTITITDNIGADDGFIFEWGIQLDPAITPNIESYVVNLLSGKWLPNTDITNDFDTVAITIPSITGINSYTFQVADEYGCTFDTVITVNSLPEMIVTTIDTTLNCGEQVILPLEIQGSTSSCIETASSNGQDDNPATVTTINNFSCVPTSGVISAMTLDGTIGGNCPNWYTYDIIINGVTQFTQQCDQVALDLTPFLPITSVSIDANDEDGFGDNVTLDLALNITYSDFPYAYTWTPSTFLNDSTLKNPIATPNANIDYLITVLDTNFGCLGYDTASIIVNNSTAVFDSVDVTCFGGSDGKILAIINGTSTPFTLEYFDSTGATIIQTNVTNTANDTLYNQPIGTYIIKITDNAGCPIWDTISINEPTPVLLANITPDATICIDGTAVLSGSVSGGTEPDSLIWNHSLIGDGPHSVIPTDSLTIYYVYGKDSLGCVSTTDSVIVLWNDSIRVADLISDSLCQDGVVNSFLLTAVPTGGDGNGYTYEWYDGTNTLIDTTQTLNANPSTNPENFTVIVSDGCSSPTATTNVDIYLFPRFQPTFDTTMIDDGCVPVEINFSNTTDPTNISSVLWDFGDGNTSTLPINTTHIYETPGTYNVTLTMTSPIGCVEDTFSFQLVTVNALPIPNFSYSPVNPTTFDTEITFENLSSNYVTSQWSFSEGSPLSSSEENPIVTFPTDEPGLYSTQLIVISDAGCVDSTIGKFIEVDGVYLRYVPNAFTPNGDGINDCFTPLGNDIDLADYTFGIYNRWGELLFQTNTLGNCWDGTYKGDMVQNGVYVWKIRSKEKYTTIVHNDWGHVTITK
jgi:gliding motility-associated-like protein